MFREDPFIKIGEIIKQIQRIDRAQKEGDDLSIKKAVNSFTDGKLYKEEAEVPETREEWITFL